MPGISTFYGLKIFMYYSDHNPPHFHVFYNEYEALIEIGKQPKIIAGNLPKRAKALAFEWAKINLDGLVRNWKNAADNKKLFKIPPLD